MKKGIIVLLITVLAAGMAFASVSGSASFSAGYDLDSKVFSIDNGKTGKNAFTFDLAAESGETAAVESGIYAKLGASLKASIKDGDMKIDFKLTDATIQAVDGLWSVNLTKVNNGVELTYDGNALDVYFANKLNWGVSLTSKEFTIVDGLTVSANAGYAVAKNDLTDPANYSYGFDADTQAEIAIAQYTEEYFLQHDDGTYYNASLAKKQEAVANAQVALAAAKAKFAEDPTADNKTAITNAEKAVKTAETNLSKEEAKVMKKFQAANAGANGGKWYTETKTSTYSESWKVYANDATNKPADETVITSITLPTTDKSIVYAIVKNGTSYTAVDYSTYKGGKQGQLITTVKSVAEKASTAYLVGEFNETTTYSDNESLYEFVANPGTATVNGGLTIAFTKDKINASVEANVAYETIAKKLSYDVAVEGGYDFVSLNAAFDSDKILDAGLEVSLESLIGIPVSFNAGATDILAKDEGRVYTAGLSVAVAGFSFSADGVLKSVADYGYGKWSANIEAGYTMDIASFSFKASLLKEAAIDAKTHDYGEAKIAVLPELSITNTTLINNATLSLAWAGSHFGGDEANASLGAVTATIGVKF